VEPDKFVSAFISQHPNNRRLILYALKDRYEKGRLDRELPTERPWLEAVHRKLIEAANRMPPMAKYFVENGIRNQLDPILQISTEPAA
jgi:hypothetical protein